MSFYSNSFTFDSIPSETYNLFISSVTDGGETDVTGSSDVLLHTEKIYRRPVLYLYGTEQSPILQMKISINSPDEITAVDNEYISKWLFGRQGYKILQVQQPDMLDIYFNCYLSSPQINKVGNIIRGYKANIICDSPFAWEFSKTYHYTFPDDVTNTNITFNNTSDNSFYTFPTLVLTASAVGGNITITNYSDNNRVFQFTNISGSEVLTVNNDLGIITSSTALKRLSNFNKNWFRLLPGVNNLNVTGNINIMDITYQNARKIAG